MSKKVIQSLMKSFLFSFLLLLCAYTSHANDGAYMGSGNHLIPISETDISVKKEILTITLVGDKAIVDVYYEMYNPGKEKKVIVGFEAPSPAGDATHELKDNGHPYISDFTILVNDTKRDHTINYFIKDDPSYKRSMSLKEFKKYIENNGESQYVLSYVFSANFVKGINIIKHTYTYEMSSNVSLKYSFDYILTAANRWANNRIDDFTLNIKAGDESYISILPTFFSKTNGWSIIGKGTMKYGPNPDINTQEDYKKSLWLFVNDGYIQFKKKKFHPKGELDFCKPNDNGENSDILEWAEKQMYLMKKNKQ